MPSPYYRDILKQEIASQSLLKTTDLFRQVSKTMTENASNFHAVSIQDSFRSFFGVPVEVCAMVWLMIKRYIPPGGKPLHLLWALLLLKVYATEAVNKVISGVDVKTFRKWAGIFIHLMADMDVISWEFRYEGKTGNAMVSVDGSDFRIFEPYPFVTKWYSHKFHGPGLRYELAVCIETGHIVWANGPFPCGSHSDLKIFQLSMKKLLDEDEFVISDGGYQDERCHKLGRNVQITRFYSILRAHHETANRRMKHFNVLSQCFRHKLALHSACSHAVANLTQLMLSILNLSLRFESEQVYYIWKECFKIKTDV